MFKSLRLRLMTIFVLLVLAIMSVAGTFLVLQVYMSQHSKFKSDMLELFTAEYIAKLEEGAISDDGYIVHSMGEISKSSKMKSRKFFVVDARSNQMLFSTAPDYNEYIFAEDGVNSQGNSGCCRIFGGKYFVFSETVRTPEGVRALIVLDTLKDTNLYVNNLIILWLQIMGGAVVVTALVAFFAGGKISRPIKELTLSAKQISNGAFDTRIEQPKSADEIGLLVDAVRDMSGIFRKTISDFSTEKNKISAIIHNMTDGVMAFDTKGRMIHINSTARKMLNVEKIEKQKFDKIFEILEANIKIGDLLYLDNNRFCEREIVREDTTLKINFAVFNNERNKTDGVLAVIHDVTKQQRLEMSRREFVANVSHELKTPLTTIKSHAETLLDVVSDNRMAETFTNTILNETDRMTRLVKDLLLISSLEGKMVLNNSRFSMKDMINDVVSTMTLVAGEKGHRLSFEAVAEIPEFYGDRDKLEQVLYNVISNSIKYTPNGGKIIIRAGRVYADFFLEVIDNGMGIPEKDLDRIFERFYRVDKARSRELGGTGLGLSISKSIIDAHGGSIKVSSKVGEGTKVIISLPVLSGKQSNIK